MTSTPSSSPSSILIVGAGVFGLSTAYALTKRPRYSSTRITVVDPHASVPSSHTATTASIDTSRIIRADYSDPHYARLADEAQVYWRQTGPDDLGGSGRYSENGLLLTTEPGCEGYVRSACDNVRQIEKCGPEGIPMFNSAEAIAEAMRAPGAAIGSGSRGYINKKSGWADAEACMRWLWRKVEATGRVEFVTGKATKVLTEGARVVGVELEDGESVKAQMTILATGAWTGTLVDLRGVASPRAQCLGYLDLTEEEASKLKDIPVHLNLATGLFYFPPSAGPEIKLARHAFGYANPTEIPAPLGSKPGEKTIITTVPFHPPEIPQIDKDVLLEFARTSLLQLKHRKQPITRLNHSRLCWYLDTASSDFLVCPFPGFETSLYIATGGSGHGFKFLPVLGAYIMDVIDGTDAREKEGLWTKKWAWPGRGKVQPTPSGHTDAYVDDDGEIWCLDGSRGGEMGQKLADALAGIRSERAQVPDIVKEMAGAETSGKGRI